MMDRLSTKSSLHLAPSLLGVYTLYVLWHAFVGLFANFPLYGDEAQYWVWGKHLDWGYYSKPPLIGWVIGAVTTFLGDNPFVVRLPSMIAHIFVAQGLVTFANERRAPVPGSLIALAYLFMPGVSFSTHIVSTDPVLLVFFAWAMVWGWRFAHDPQGTTATWIGVVLGLGFLAKYAMIWFVIMYPLAVWFGRKSFKPTKMCAYLPLVLALIGLFLLPNLYWNHANGWPTLSHTAGNVGTWGRFNIKNASVFVLAQVGMIGPMLAYYGLSSVREALSKVDVRYALGLAVPVFVFVLIQAVLNRSHANWAGVGHLGLIYALVIALAKHPILLRRSILLNVMLALIMGALSIAAYQGWLPAKLNPYQRFYKSTRILSALDDRGITVDDKVIVCDNRQLVAQLTYQLRGTNTPVVRYNPDFQPLDYFGMNTDMRTHPERDRIFIGPTCLHQSKYINIKGLVREEKLELGKPFKPLCLQVFRSKE